MRVAKYWTPLKAAHAMKTATQTAAKDLFFQTYRGIIHVLPAVSNILSQYKNAGNNTVAKHVKAIGTGLTNAFGDSATILPVSPSHLQPPTNKPKKRGSWLEGRYART